MLVKLPSEALPELTFHDLPGTRPWRESPDSLLGSHHSKQENQQLINTGETPGIQKHSQITPFLSFPAYCAIYSFAFIAWPPSVPQDSNLPFAVTSQTRQGFANQPLLLTAFSRLDISPPRTGHEDTKNPWLTSSLFSKESGGFT